MQAKIDNNLVKLTQIGSDYVHYFTSLQRVAKFLGTYRDKIDYYYLKKAPLNINGNSYMIEIVDGADIKYKEIN